MPGLTQPGEKGELKAAVPEDILYYELGVVAGPLALTLRYQAYNASQIPPRLCPEPFKLNALRVAGGCSPDLLKACACLGNGTTRPPAPVFLRV